MSERDPSLPGGVVLFPEGMPVGVRRRRLTLAAVVLLAAVALGWPVYPIFGGVFPLVLGLPLSFAWVILWLLVVFAALVWVYRGEPEEVEAAPDAGARSPGR